MLLKRQVLKVISHVALALTVSKILKFQIVYLKKQVKVIRCNFRIGIIRWQIFKSLKVVPCIFALALTASDRQTVGQGHRVQFLQLYHSMANAKIYKCLIFALTVPEV